MAWVQENWQTILLFITSVMAIASQLAALTPSKSDDEAVSWFRKVFDAIAGNYGAAKNAKPTK